MSFKTYLGWIVPGYRRHKERLNIYRKYLVAQYLNSGDYLGVPTVERDKTAEQKAEDQIMMETKQAKLYMDYNRFYENQDHLKHFRVWLNREQRRNANRKRWKK